MSRIHAARSPLVGMTFGMALASQCILGCRHHSRFDHSQSTDAAALFYDADSGYWGFVSTSADLGSNRISDFGIYTRSGPKWVSGFQIGQNQVRQFDGPDGVVATTVPARIHRGGPAGYYISYNPIEFETKKLIESLAQPIKVRVLPVPAGYVQRYADPVVWVVEFDAGVVPPAYEPLIDPDE